MKLGDIWPSTFPMSYPKYSERTCKLTKVRVTTRHLLALPMVSYSTTDRVLSNQGRDPMRTLLFPQTSSYLLSDDTPTRKAHCLLCGITQIPNISLTNTKTRNHTVQSSSFHLAEDESEITSEWGLPSRQCKRLAPAQEGHSLLLATAGHL